MIAPNIRKGVVAETDHYQLLDLDILAWVFGNSNWCQNNPRIKQIDGLAVRGSGSAGELRGMVTRSTANTLLA